MSDNPPPQQEAAFFTAIRGWGVTRGDNGVVGGVVEGLGDRIGLARVPARIITVVLWFVLPGIIALAYAAGWALLPSRRGTIIIQDFGRGVTNVGALLGIALLTVIGFAAFDSGPLFNATRWAGPWGWDIGPWGGGGAAVSLVLGFFAFLIPLALVAGLVVLIVWLVRRDSGGTVPPPGTPASGVPGAGPDGAAASGAADAGEDTAPRTVPVPPPPGAGPQPWEPAYLPGDPRAGVPASRGATPASAYTASAAYATATAARPHSRPAPYVPGPGKAGYLAALGILLVCGAGVAIAERNNELAVAPSLAWFAAATVGLGILVIAISVAGRRLGFLGFVSVVAVGLGVILAAQGQSLRETYDSVITTLEREITEGWRDDVGADDVWVEPALPDEPFPATAFADDYTQVYLDSGCRVLGDISEEDYRWPDTSTGVIRAETSGSDIAIDVVAMQTDVRIPAGSSIEISGAYYGTVVWPQRDLICDVDVDNPDQPWIRLIQADSPVVSLTAEVDGPTIIIEEDGQ